MISKRIYLFLTGALLLLGVSTGFAMQNQQSYNWTALKALETANSRLSKANPDQTGHQAKALELVRQAIHEMKAGLSATNRACEKKKHSTT